MRSQQLALVEVVIRSKTGGPEESDVPDCGDWRPFQWPLSRRACFQVNIGPVHLGGSGRAPTHENLNQACMVPMQERRKRPNL
ncbi:hypothetical protein SKAU_G00175240 [Synaphobranchus kaupii]|uniref:Uncharacterized protein n=1 Tax=Synaphobranchus kaupii TaxID=118154 RepID=A0A9Q1FLS1_SYNKA|nr:hypothetical protein SKAU_G00175240 [Synaphobranchus kaupii]